MSLFVICCRFLLCVFSARRYDSAVHIVAMSICPSWYCIKTAKCIITQTTP